MELAEGAAKGKATLSCLALRGSSHLMGDLSVMDWGTLNCVRRATNYFCVTLDG